MNFLLLALKNISRAKKRSAMTLAILSLGVAIYILFGNLIEGFLNLAVDDMRNEDIADIRIRSGNYDEDFPISDINLWYESDNALKNIEGIDYTPRITLSADIDNYQDSLPIMLIGINEDTDTDVFSIKTNSTTPLDDRAWVAASLANDMDVDIGDYINLTFRSPSGTFISGEYEIGGLLVSTNPIFSEHSVIVDINELQELLNSNFISYYSVKLSNPSKLDQIAKDITSYYPNQEVLTWEDLTSDLTYQMELRKKLFNVFFLMITVITLLGLINSILISVWEKRRNTGTLRALGFYDREILQIFMYEGFWIGLIGTIIGIILATLLNIPLSNEGINFATVLKSEDGTSINIGMYVPPVVKSVWNIKYFIMPLIFLPIVAMFVSYLPARKSISMSIVDCIRNKD